MRLGRLANAAVSATLSVIMAVGLLPGVALASEQANDPTTVSTVVEEEVSSTITSPVRTPVQDLSQEPALDYGSVEVEDTQTPAIDPGAEPYYAEQAPTFTEQYEYEEPAPAPVPAPEAPGDVEATSPDTPRNVKASDVTLYGDAHIQGRGWVQAEAAGSVVLGVTGKGKRLEALRLLASCPDGVEGGIRYRAHVQRKGWMGECEDGQVAGTVGQALRLEALRIELTGELASSCDLWYRVHVSGIGWLAWAANGASAGSQSLGKRVEAVQIALVAKGAGHPAGACDANVAFVRPKDMYHMGVKKVSGDVQLDMILDEFVKKRSGTGGKALRRAYEIITNYPYRYQDTNPKGAWKAWSVPYAKDIYTNRSGNCFRYASLMCWVARRLGYDAKVVSGYVYTRAHTRTPHGWCEITMRGKKYVIDPNMYHNHREKNWFMVAYDAAPIEYLSAKGQYK